MSSLPRERQEKEEKVPISPKHDDCTSNEGGYHVQARRLIEGPDGVDRHELVLVGAGAAVEAERDEQEGNADELGGRVFLVDSVLTTGGRFLLVPDQKGEERRGMDRNVEPTRGNE
jgi:hypothetical protein